MKPCSAVILLPLAYFFFISAGHTQNLLPSLKEKFGDNVALVDSSVFKEFYTINVRQAIDHRDTSKGFFTQRVFFGYNGAPSTVLITHGYEAAPLPFMLRYKNEVSAFLDANQVFVEHRYFGSSIPDSTNLQYANFEQAAHDYHQISSTLSRIYRSKWITVGISKGGQTALNYRFYFPNDMDASILYVTPVLNNIADKRISKFLANKRTTPEGRKVFEIQKHLLRNKTRLLPLFKEMVLTPGAFDGLFGYTKTTALKFDFDTLFDLGVLEFDFNYWQLLGDYKTLKVENQRTLEHLTTQGFKHSYSLKNEYDSLLATLLSCIYWMVDSTLHTPFLHQAFTQAGFYDYDEQSFYPWLKYKEYSLRFLVNNPAFDSTYSTAFQRFIKSGLAKTIFIYGASDPYTAAQPLIDVSRDNMIIINPATNHNTRIGELPLSDKKRIETKLKKWLSTAFTIP